jgi:anti-anti-sigma factor
MVARISRVKERSARAVYVVAGVDQGRGRRFGGRSGPFRKGLTMMEHSVFSCSVARHAGDVDVEVFGSMDRTTAGQFRNQLLNLAKEHPTSIAIHMDDLALMDSSCVAVLIETWRFAEEHGIALTVKSPAASIRQVFDVAESGRLLTLRR